ncbi:MAG: site-2 protease family protein [Candidatus Bathyarchaeia archaeon]
MELDPIQSLAAYSIGWLGLFALSRILRLKEKGISVGPFYLSYKTKAFNGLLEAISRKGDKFWRAFFNSGAALGIGMMTFIIYRLAMNAGLLAHRAEGADRVAILVPGITVGFESLPYLLLAIAVLVVTHEASHGIASLLEGIKPKSVGAFLAFVIPGAFVELDEKELSRLSWRPKLRIFAAGSSANICLALIFLILLSNFPATIYPIYSTQPSGVLITGIVEGGPAEEAGIRSWDVIFSINGTRIWDPSALRSYLSMTKPGSVLITTTDRGDFPIVTKAHPLNSSRATIGIYPFPFFEPKAPFAPKELPYRLLIAENWLFMVLLNVAMINMLPMYPLDGDKYLDALLDAMGIKRRREMRMIASILCAGLLLVNLTLSYMNFGLFKF